MDCRTQHNMNMGSTKASLGPVSQCSSHPHGVPLPRPLNTCAGCWSVVYFSSRGPLTLIKFSLDFDTQQRFRITKGKALCFHSPLLPSALGTLEPWQQVLASNRPHFLPCLDVSGASTVRDSICCCGFERLLLGLLPLLQALFLKLPEWIACLFEGFLSS